MADLLVDEGIGVNLVLQLRDRGFRIFHTLEFQPKRSADSLVFLEAQRRQLTVFTWNRDDFTLLADAWHHWGHGGHYGVISRPIGQSQLSPPEAYQVLEQYRRDTSSFVDRIELF